MSASIKLGLLALVGAAAAAPHYSAHSRFHHKPSGTGYVGPSAGWGNQGNNTKAAAGPTGSSSVPVPIPSDEPTTTLDETSTSTTTIFTTIYATPASSPAGGAGGASSVGAVDVSTGPSVCGPATVTVTATNQVTVTVPAGGASSPSGPAVSSPAVEAPSSAGYTASSPAAVPSSSVIAEEKPSSKAPVVSIPAISSPAESAVPTVAPSSVVEASSSTPASSSAAPSSTAPSSGGYSGGKRGLAYRYDNAAQCKSFAGNNFGFAWNWESDSRGDIGGTTFIPTLRTANPENTNNWLENAEAAIKAGSPVVFGLNEPDHADQANLGWEDACKVWVEYMNPIAEKHPEVTVVGPSVSSEVAEGKGLSWLSQFMDNCDAAKFTDVNLHWYGAPSDGFEAFKTHIENGISQTGRNVWVTEFGYIPNSATAEETADFLEKAQSYLESNDKVKGYSFYAVGSFDPARIMLGTADALTEAGKVYVS